MPDDGRRHRLAEELVEEWCKVEPQAATEWAGSLVFENPASRLHVFAEALERWWMFDPHGASTWAVAHAPEELYSQIRELIGQNR